MFPSPSASSVPTSHDDGALKSPKWLNSALSNHRVAGTVAVRAALPARPLRPPYQKVDPMTLARHSRAHRFALLLASLLTATGAADIAAAVPAHAASLSATPDCESGAGHFTCLSDISGGTAPYTYSWQAVTNAFITSSK